MGLICTRLRILLTVTALLGAAAPVSAKDIYVPAGGNLQSAINNAVPGDRILLEPGASFVGNFKLPNKGSSTDYITIRSAAADTLLPQAGQRVLPSDAANLPILRSPNTVSALTTAPGAHHWRLQWLEFRANDRGYGDIIALGAGDGTQTSVSQAPHDLVLEHLYVHGDPVIGQKRGIALHSGATWLTDSYISDIKAVGVDTQAVMGYNGPGPYHIVNNYLEASGENVLFGGASPKIPNLIPSDIEFRRNHLFKPLSWRNPILSVPTGVSATALAGGGTLPAGVYSYRIVAARRTTQDTWTFSARSTEVVVTVGAGGRVQLSWAPVPNATLYRVFRGTAAGAQDRYFETTTGTTLLDDGTLTGKMNNGTTMTGSKWLVKNLFELKLGLRVTITENLMENCWLDGQTGYAVLFTPRNQDNTSPWIYVREVTFSNNVVRHAGSGVQIEGYDSNYVSQQTQRIVIQNNLFDDIKGSRWGGPGRFLQIGNQPRDITIDHNTVDNDGHIIYIYGRPAGVEQSVSGFVLTNNLFKHNAYGIMGDGHTYGNDTIGPYFPGATIARNTFAGGSASRYPANNEFPTVAYWLSQFVDAAAGDYQLVDASPWRATGTDGLDLGVSNDVVASIGRDAERGAPAESTPIDPVSIAAAVLPAGVLGTAYSAQLAASGGSGRFMWAVSGGSLPDGLSLDPAAGTIGGVPQASGPAEFVVLVRDAADAANISQTALGITVLAPPAVAVIAPEGGTFVGRNLALAASASDQDGTVVKVEYFANGQLIGSAAAPPWTVVWSEVPQGSYRVDALATDDSGLSASSASIALNVVTPIPPVVSLTSPMPGAALAGSVQIDASATAYVGSVARVDFYADQALVGSAMASPWSTMWSAPVGSHVLRAVVTDTFGQTASSDEVQIGVNQVVPGRPAGEIVAYAGSARTIAGLWQKYSGTAAAGGSYVGSVDRGVNADTIASATPVNYVDVDFNAPAGTAYHVWLRLRAAADSRWNDSVFVQFSDALGAADAQPIYRIGTTDALIIGLEDCDGCGVAGWGWNDDVWYRPRSDVVFQAGGRHVVRLQLREDGTQVDQIVLTPADSGAGSPGKLKKDTVILPATY